MSIKLIISIKVFNLLQITVRADSHVSSGRSRGQFCTASLECQTGSHCVKAGPTHPYGTCQCLPGYIPTDTWAQCLAPKHYKEECEYNQQCHHFDPNTVCDHEQGRRASQCLCDDYHKYNIMTMKCQWCDDQQCRRQSFLLADHMPLEHMSYNQPLDRWYYNVNGVFGVWASLLIIAFPISIFLFFLGLRLSKKLLNLQSSGLESNSNSLLDSEPPLLAEPRLLVSLPPEYIPLEPPPAYEDLSKAIRLPTYEEAIVMS